MNNENFIYTYSAKEQDEIKKIREKYLPKQEDKLEQLRRLDRNATDKGTMKAIIVGVVGTLLLGLGMSCTLVWQGIWFIPGIIVGVIGIGIMSVAYPLYNYVVKKERQRIAPEVIRLTDELLK